MLVARTMVLVVSILASACRKCPPPPAEPPPCEDPNGTRLCPTGSCGANSPTINGFPINGLRPNGECNADGVQLVPGSLAGGTCAGATLDVEDNALIGRRLDGSIQCEGHALDGATFEVRSWVPVSASDATKRSVRIKIVNSAPRPHAGGETRTAYQMVRADHADKGTLCGADESNDLRSALGLKPTLGLGSARAATEDVVIPVVSELYDVLGSPIGIRKSWRQHSRMWLNLACTNDALAERSLYHVYTDNLLRSRAVLRMLTANYCGNKPFTMRGMSVAWGTGPAEQLEARWTPDGATCLSKPRALYRDDAAPQHVPDYLPPHLKEICDGKQCPDIAAWIAAVRVCAPGEKPIPSCEPQVADPDPIASFVVLPGEGPRP